MDKDNIEKQEESREIALEQSTVRAFGRLLRQQIFPKKSIDIILENVRSTQLGDNESNVFSSFITSSIESIMDIIGLMERTKEVKLINEVGEWDFKFSEERDIVDTEKPQPGEVIIDKDLASKVFAAIDHNFKNKLSPVRGFSELGSQRSNSDRIREQFQKINTMAIEIDSKLSKTTKKPQHNVKLITDSDGQTTLSYVPVQ